MTDPTWPAVAMTAIKVGGGIALLYIVIQVVALRKVFRMMKRG